MEQAAPPPLLPTRGTGSPASRLALPATAALLRLRMENSPHGRHQLGFGDRHLRRAALAPFLVVGDLGREARAFDEVLHLDLAPGALVAALDHDARCRSAVGISHLR